MATQEHERPLVLVDAEHPQTHDLNIVEVPETVLTGNVIDIDDENTLLLVEPTIDFSEDKLVMPFDWEHLYRPLLAEGTRPIYRFPKEDADTENDTPEITPGRVFNVRGKTLGALVLLTGTLIVLGLTDNETAKHLPPIPTPSTLTHPNPNHR